MKFLFTNAILKKILYMLFRVLPKKNVVLFSSFNGMYNDNPKYVSEKLHEINPDIPIYWIADKATCKILPKYVQPLKKDSLVSHIMYVRSKVIVENYSGVLMAHASSNNKLIQWIIKDKKQLNVSTWHGTPLKKIADDVKNKSNTKKRLYSSSDFLIAGSKFIEECFKTALPGIPVRRLGTPRNDILVNQSIDVDKLKIKLHLPIDKKIILFAPTFRDDLYNSGIRQMEEINFNKIFECISKKFGGDWVLACRMHHYVMNEIDLNKYCEKFSGRIIDANQFQDMAEYLMCADVLLTDYSSSMFDYMLTKRPVFLYTPDRKHYESTERGFYMYISELPFPCADTALDLLKSINEFELDSYKDACDTFCSKLGMHEKGIASVELSKYIINYINR